MRCFILACCLLPLVVSSKADSNVILRVHLISSEDLKTIVGDEELTSLSGLTAGLPVGKYINNLSGGGRTGSLHGYPLCTINARPELRQLDTLNYEQVLDITSSLGHNGVNENGQPVINCVLVIDEKYPHYGTTTVPPGMSTTTMPPTIGSTTTPGSTTTTTTTPSSTITTTTPTPTTTTTTTPPSSTTTTTRKPYPTYYPSHKPYPPHPFPPYHDPWYPNYPSFPSYPGYPYFPYPYAYPPFPFTTTDDENRHEVNDEDGTRTTPSPIKRPPFPQPQRPPRPASLTPRPRPTYPSATNPQQPWHSLVPNNNNSGSGLARRSQSGPRPGPRPRPKTQLRRPLKYVTTTAPPEADDFDSLEDNVHYIEVSKNFH